MIIKAILADIDNTLIDFDKSAEKAIEKTAEKLGVTLPDGYFPIFLRINAMLWSKLEREEITKDDIYKNRWKLIFKELSIDEDYSEFEEEFRKQMRVTAIPIEKAKELLEYLSEKYSLYTASNSSKIQQESRLKMLGFDKYFDGLFTSEDIGFQKPSKEFFYECCKTLYPISPDNIIMIGDSLEADIVGAKNFGLKSIWFDYYKENTDIKGLSDYRVDKLSDIMTIL